MPFYIKDYVKVGPFRFNFSKSGIGISVGIKGLRVGTGPRGHYVHAGRKGIYYRASLNGAGSKLHNSKQTNNLLDLERQNDSEIEMKEIDSDDVLDMKPEEFSELLSEINEKQRKTRISTVFTWIFIIAGIASFFLHLALALTVLALAFPARLIGKYIDNHKRVTVIMYDLEDIYKDTYLDLTRVFDRLNESEKKWHIEASGDIRNLADWKQNAGATSVIRRKETPFIYSQPDVIKSNVNPPCIQVGIQILYFFPDVILVVDGKNIGAVSYDDLNLEIDQTNFIEEETVPNDSDVIGYTWKHPNKSGGPDRRFNDNYQIPICRYEMVHLTSSNGLNEILEFSRIGNLQQFKMALSRLSTVS